MQPSLQQMRDDGHASCTVPERRFTVYCAELQQFCEKVPHENVAAIRCLQDKVEDPQFGAACKAEVQVFEQHISADYRRGVVLASRGLAANS